MFVTIRRYQGKPGQTEETVSRVKTGLLPILTRQQGFASYTAVDAGNDVAVSVSTYESDRPQPRVPVDSCVDPPQRQDRRARGVQRRQRPRRRADIDAGAALAFARITRKGGRGLGAAAALQVHRAAPPRRRALHVRG